MENEKDISSFFRNLNISQLSEGQEMSCEGNISLEECFKILHTFPNNKTPGNDGIRIAFYKEFWRIISDGFLKCVKEIFDKGECHVPKTKQLLPFLKTKGKIALY